MGHFGPFSGVFRPFGAPRRQTNMLPQGPATRINVPSDVEIEAFLASFRAISAVFWAVFAPLGPFGALLGSF